MSRLEQTVRDLRAVAIEQKKQAMEVKRGDRLEEAEKKIDELAAANSYLHSAKDKAV